MLSFIDHGSGGSLSQVAWNEARVLCTADEVLLKPLMTSKAYFLKFVTLRAWNSESSCGIYGSLGVSIW